MLAGDPEAVGDLVDANHILARRGLLDGFGHVSARDGEHFLIARNLAPARVGTADVMRVAFDGTVR
jgi:ribulose-5-phosphate 4-epimerase/fuculose-1-phosphate aldolase